MIDNIWNIEIIFNQIQINIRSIILIIFFLMESSSPRIHHIKAVLDRYKISMKKKVEFAYLVSKFNQLINEQSGQLKSMVGQIYQSMVTDIIYEQLMQAKELEYVYNPLETENIHRNILKDSSSAGSSPHLSSDEEDNDDAWKKPKNESINRKESEKESKKRQRSTEHAKNIDQMSPDEMRKLLKFYKSNNPFMPPPLNPNEIPPPPTYPPPPGYIAPAPYFQMNKKIKGDKKQFKKMRVEGEVDQKKIPKQQKKNCLYIKNLPRHYNTAQALTTFFKKYGPIREVSSQVDKNIACITFFKQQDAVSASTTQQKVFGKVFIFKTLNADEEPPERVKEQIKKIEIQKTQQTEEKNKMQLKHLKQHLISRFAERYRTLLFLIHRVKDDTTELKSDLEKCKNQKKEIEELSEENIVKFNEEKGKNHDYDPTVYINKALPEFDDKKYLSTRFEKYGKAVITSEPLQKEIKIRYFSLDSILKLYIEEDKKDLEIRFNNLKMNYYIDKILNTPVSE